MSHTLCFPPDWQNAVCRHGQQTTSPPLFTHPGLAPTTLLCAVATGFSAGAVADESGAASTKKVHVSLAAIACARGKGGVRRRGNSPLPNVPVFLLKLPSILFMLKLFMDFILGGTGGRFSPVVSIFQNRRAPSLGACFFGAFRGVGLALGAHGGRELGCR